MTKPRTWQCSACGCKWRLKVAECPHYFDDYLSVRDVTSIEEAINQVVQIYYYKFDQAIWLLGGKNE